MRALLVATLSILTGCASAARRPAPPPSNQAEADAARRAMAEAAAHYKITTDDLVAVSVYGERDMNVHARVDGEGRISLPLVGPVQIGGATVAEAQRRIEARLSDYLVHPQASLVVEAYATRQLFVLGEVQKPGPYALPADLRVTLLQAIAGAGGFTKVAAPRKTHVLRYIDGRIKDYTIDLKALLRDEPGGTDMLLKPNDVVYVPQSVF